MLMTVKTAEAVARLQDASNVTVDPFLTERHWGRLQGEIWQDHFAVPTDGESDEESVFVLPCKITRFQ